MKITVELMTDEAIALRRLGVDFSPLPLEEAARFALREFLISHGYLELPEELDEDTETHGEA